MSLLPRCGSTPNTASEKPIWVRLATQSNCGNILRAFATTPLEKSDGGTRLIAVPNGNNAKDWTIRSQAPKGIKPKEKVQRLNGCGSSLQQEGLRYSPATLETWWIIGDECTCPSVLSDCGGTYSTCSSILPNHQSKGVQTDHFDCARYCERPIFDDQRTRAC